MIPMGSTMRVWTGELERVVRGLDRAVEFAESYRFEMTDDYRALVAQVEALPQNRQGADKSGRWRGSRAFQDRLAASARLMPREP